MLDDWEDFESEKTTHEQKRQLKITATRRIEKLKSEGVKIKYYDYGRQMVYRNEWDAHKKLGKPIQMTIAEMRAEAERIFKDERVMEIDPYPGEKIYVEPSVRDGAVAKPFQRRMRFGTLRDNFTLLHEIAHILAVNDLHGDDFCKVLCSLHEWFISEENGKILREAFGG